MSSTPILSIIIPTKNRYIYLFEILKIIKNYDFKNEVEVVIQDNSINNSQILDFLRNNNGQYDFVKYFYSTAELSQAGNSDLAVKNSSGEYLCFIGDDDCVTKGILDAVKWMKESNCEVLITNKPSYVWSDLKPKNLGDTFRGMLVSYHYTGKFEKKDSLKELMITLKHGGQKILNLPQFYHNIVKKETLDKIYFSTGTYFPGPSPDMAVAISLATIVKDFIKLDYPLVLSGQGSGSVGGMGAKGKHIGELKNIPFLPKNIVETWSLNVPFYWSGSTIYADSTIKALKSLNKSSLINKFNFSYLYAHCYIFDSFYRDRVIHSIRQNQNVSLVSFSINYLNIWALRLKSFLSNRVRINIFVKKRFYSELPTISKALTFLEKEVSSVIPPWK